MFVQCLDCKIFFETDPNNSSTCCRCNNSNFKQVGESLRTYLMQDHRDTLSEMFALQKSLQETLGYNFDTMCDEDRKKYLDEYFKHAHQELFEAQIEIPGFKPWKVYSYDADTIGSAYQSAKEELIDVWHFFMNLCIALNMSAEEFYELYRAKNAENYARQKKEEYKACLEK